MRIREKVDTREGSGRCFREGRPTNSRRDESFIDICKRDRGSQRLAWIEAVARKETSDATVTFCC